MSDCKKCREDGTGESAIQCDKCDQWTHYSCAGLAEEDVQNILNYFCDDCENEEHLTSWVRKEPRTFGQWAIKELDYYEVEDIIGHREKRNGREFLVKWKEVPDAEDTRAETWEPEKHLDGAIDYLQRYCRRQKIALSKIVGLLGADSSNLELTNRDNWVTMDTILTHVSKLRSRLNIKTQIKVLQWTDFGNEDCLYFLDHGFHCFVLLHVVKRNAAYIADGGNLFRENKKVANEIRQLLGIRLISLRFNQQLKVDHCGSSAILIGIQMLRMYAKGMTYQDIVCPKYLREMLTKKLHTAQSKPLELPALGKRRAKLVCPFCAKTYKSTAQRKLNMHIIRWHKSETNK